MKKFVVMTRGRTGSTAIIDQLNKSKRVMAVQELFLKYDFSDKPALLSQLYQVIPPFEIWRERANWWQRIARKRLDGKGLVKSYLKESELHVWLKRKEAFCFKLLSHHLVQTPFLREALLERRYRVVYLTRNIPRQVISGMVAKLRGKYNAHATEEYEDVARYRIDVDEFEALVKWEVQAVRNDLEMLKSSGFDFIEISYEEFMADRQALFDRILGFVGASTEQPQASSFSVMIKDLEHTIENYQAVADRAAAMGMHIE